MNIREILRQSRLTSGPHGDHLGIELLLSFVMGRDRAYLISHGEEAVPESVLGRFLSLFDRMIQGEPVAYILGKKEFFGMDFSVDRRVLIPRPETEHLVEKIVDYAGSSTNNASEQRVRVLDVGTGSGCIAVSVAKHLPSSEVVGIDISVDALEVAERNATAHGVGDRVVFLQSDLLASVDGPFDIVVANLPYIGEKRFSFVSKSAADYEPHVALFGGEDGLGLYHRFFEQLSRKSWRPRLLVGEFGFLQKDELIRLFLMFFPDHCIRFEQDYAHIDRMFVVEWPSYV